MLATIDLQFRSKVRKDICFFFADLSNTCDIPDKDKYIEKERLRWAHYFSVPMMETPPENFPPLTLATQRVICAVSAQSESKTIAVLDALFHSFWVDGNGKIGQPEGFMLVLEQVLGKDDAAQFLQAVSLFLRFSFLPRSIMLMKATVDPGRCERAIDIKHDSGV